MDNALLPPSAFQLPLVQLNTEAEEDICFSGSGSEVTRLSLPVENRSMQPIWSTHSAQCDCDHVERCHWLESELMRTRSDLSEAESVCRSAKANLSALRAYVGNQKPDSQDDQGDSTFSFSPIQKSRSTEAQNKKLLCAVVEKEKMQEELRLLHVQLHSLEKVLRLQEKAAAPSRMPIRTADNSSPVEGVSSDDTTSTAAAAADRLLTAWRHHVLRLLVQRAADGEAMEAVKATLDSQFKSQGEEIRSQNVSIEALTFKLTAKEAAFEVVNNKSKVLALKTQELNECLEEKKLNYSDLKHTAQNHLFALLSDLSQMSKTWMRVFFIDAVSSNKKGNECALVRRLQGLEHRIDFACRRLPLVRALLHRRQKPTARRPPMDTQAVQTDAPIPLPASFDHLPSSVLELKDLLRAAVIERQQALSDRDLLANRLEEETRHFNHQLTDVHQENKCSMDIMRQQMKQFETRLKEKDLELETTASMLKGVQDDRERILTEALETKARLESELARTNSEMAKTVIGMRRAERYATREQSERQTQIAEIESTYGSQVIDLKQNLKEATHKLLMRPTQLHPTAYMSPLRPNEVFTTIHNRVCKEENEKNSGIMVNRGESSTSDNSVVGSLTEDHLGSVRETLSRLVDLAKCLEDDEPVDELK